MNTRRVVITGLGVVAPNAKGVKDFTEALRTGRSGIEYYETFKEMGFGSHVGAFPKLDEEEVKAFKRRFKLKKLVSSGILYACLAGVEAWEDAGLEVLPQDALEPHWDTGCIFGQGITGIESTDIGIKLMDQGKMRKVSGRTVQQSMSSGPSAYLGGILGLGNQITGNSSACSTGTEALLMAYDRIRFGLADRMLAGGCDSDLKYVTGCFDVMRVLNRQHNDRPGEASRPMSATAAGFVIGSGAGAYVLESLESAQARGARIYAEVLGGALNSGGQRGEGSITSPSDVGIVRCIEQTMEYTGIEAADVDAINGHLTSTVIGDPVEIKSWVKALGRSGKDFPLINATKSMTGHALSAAGGLECVGTLLQMHHRFFHPSLNCEDLHPVISELVDRSRIPMETLNDVKLHTVVKASFGFGDVNSCVAFRNWTA
jgi:3-oxoacyl-[acyl-carrier-protein] synthase I